MLGGEGPGWELSAALVAATGTLFLTGPGVIALEYAPAGRRMDSPE